MNKKVLLIIGIVLLLLSLLADVIGIGREPGFGMGQIAGAIIGLLIIVFAVRGMGKK
jgi:peptidoglycan/LPS O-acetylase OafA/YrhL